MYMPQLHFYLPKELAEQVKKNAKRQGKTASAYVAEIVKQKLERSWPPGYFESFRIDDPTFVEPEDLPVQERDLSW